MPIYEYGLTEGHEGCDHCRGGFSIFQHIEDEKLTECPECGAPIQRLIFAVGINTPKTNTELKDMGFTKLVKRDDGVYENVTRRGEDAKYMERGKKDTIPDISKTISD
jgi:putative FmdB family regulatory protein